MKPIGGYIEWELPHIGHSYHPAALALSTGRAALRLALKVLQPVKCYLPFYTCDSLIDPVLAQGIPFEFYELDHRLDPGNLPVLKQKEYFILVNYYGLRTATVEKLAANYGKQLIIDATHDFFNNRYHGHWAFTSARKYFGVPDGAYLYKPDEVTFSEEFPRFTGASVHHLFNRRFGDPELAYRQYLEYEESLDTEVRAVSEVSEKWLNTIDYAMVIDRRRENFYWLHEQLRPYNTLPIEFSDQDVPFRYPFLPEKPIAKAALMEAKLFIPSFWSDVPAREIPGYDWEKKLANELLPLPNDHRYRPSDLKRLTDFIIKNIQGNE